MRLTTNLTTNRKKLSLTKETLRTLTPTELRLVAGGGVCTSSSKDNSD